MPHERIFTPKFMKRNQKLGKLYFLRPPPPPLLCNDGHDEKENCINSKFYNYVHKKNMRYCSNHKYGKLNIHIFYIILKETACR